MASSSSVPHQPVHRHSLDFVSLMPGAFGLDVFDERIVPKHGECGAQIVVVEWSIIGHFEVLSNAEVASRGWWESVVALSPA